METNAVQPKVLEASDQGAPGREQLLEPQQPRSRRWHLGATAISALVLALIGTGLSGWIMGAPHSGIDDAEITFIYARNLVAGEGLVYTPGFERVEGFTSLLWMLCCGVFSAISATPETPAFIFSLLLCALSLLTVLRIVSLQLELHAEDSTGPNQASRAVVQCVALAWLVGSTTFFAWTTWTLMDTGLWCLWSQLACLLLVHEVASRSQSRRWPQLLGLVAAGMLLTRPEALLLVPFSLLLGVIVSRANLGHWRPALSWSSL
jgi:hypothetical protein